MVPRLSPNGKMKFTKFTCWRTWEKRKKAIRSKISTQIKWLKWETICWENFHINGDDFFGVEILYWLKIENLNFDVSDIERSRGLDKMEIFGWRRLRFISDTPNISPCLWRLRWIFHPCLWQVKKENTQDSGLDTLQQAQGIQDRMISYSSSNTPSGTTSGGTSLLHI